MTVRSHQTGVGKHPDGHEKRAVDEHGAPTPAIHVDERRDGHADVDDVLDAGCDEVDVTAKSSHAEDVCNV